MPLALIQVIHMYIEFELPCAGAPSTVADEHVHSAFKARPFTQCYHILYFL